MKKLIITGMILGSYGGSYLPVIWGGSLFSMISIICSAAGGFAGIWMGYKLASRIGIE